MMSYDISNFIFKFDNQRVFQFMCEYLYNLSSYSEIRPMRLFAYPSARCNDSCRYCAEYKKYNPKVDFFSNRKHIDKLVNDIKETGFKDIHLFGGGDPFFYKDNMFFFLQRMIEVDAFIRIITNGINLGEKDINNIVEDKLASQLNITLNTESEEAASKLYTNKERHSHTLFILDTIAKYKELYSTRFPLVDIMFVLSNINYDKIFDVISSLKRFNINYFFIQPLRIDCEDHEKLALSKPQEEEFLKSLPKIERVLRESNIRSNINDFNINKNLIEDSKGHRSVIPDRILFGRDKKLGCYFPLTTFGILSDGAIPKCYYLLHEFCSKDYFSLGSLTEHFNSKEYINFVTRFIGNDCLSDCNNCSICILYEIEEIKENFSHFRNPLAK